MTEEYVRSTQGVFQFELSGKTIACAALPSNRHWVFSNRSTLKAGPEAGQLHLFRDVPALGPLEQVPGAAAPGATHGASVPTHGWCGHRQGALGATGEGPAAPRPVSKAQPLGSPAHGPSTRCLGRRGRLLAEHLPAWDCHGTAGNAHGCSRLVGQQRGRAQHSLLPSHLTSLSVQVMVEALGILT